MALKLLVVLSSHSALGDTGKETGWYLPELAHPFYHLQGKAELVVASPKGGEAPLDPGSVEAFKDDPASARFLKEEEAVWKKTSKLEYWVGKTDEFVGIFYVGGHGPMYDLVDNAASQKLAKDFYESGKIVSAVCHGPAALLNVKLSDGSYLVDGKEITTLTDAEENALGSSSAMPFMLETELKSHGAKILPAKELFGEKVVTSGEGGRLITGQNPASGLGISKAILAAI